jgi:hypothetical protein
MTTYIADIDHYNQVIAHMCKAERLLWIIAANLNDLYAKKSVLSMTPPKGVVIV